MGYIMIIITVRTQAGRIIRDTQEITNESILVIAINAWLEQGCTLVALEEIDDTVEAFYSKRLTDDDIDAMAADIPE